MVDTVYGVNAVSGAPSYSGKQYRQTNSAAFAGATAARPLGGRTGVRPGTSVTTVTATSTVWTCGPFAGVADVETAVEASVYPFAFDANATGAVTAAHATLARKDIIYVQIDDPAESDGSFVPAATRKYLAGTASGSPVAPATPVTRAFVIAEINVPASGGGSPTVTWVAPYCAAAGGAIFSTTFALLPASGGIAGQVAEVFADASAALNGTYRWSGSAWVQIHSPAYTDAAGWTVTLASGKRTYKRSYAPSGALVTFGATGGTNYVQTQASAIPVPTGKDWSNFNVQTPVWPVDTSLNSLQALIVGYLSASTGAGPVNLLLANPTAVSIANTNMNLQAAIILTEK